MTLRKWRQAADRWRERADADLGLAERGERTCGHCGRRFALPAGQLALPVACHWTRCERCRLTRREHLAKGVPW